MNVRARCTSLNYTGLSNVNVISSASARTAAVPMLCYLNNTVYTWKGNMEVGSDHSLLYLRKPKGSCRKVKQILLTLSSNFPAWILLCHLVVNVIFLNSDVFLGKQKVNETKK